MHIPDNYLSPSTCAVMGAVMIPIWVISAKKVKKELSKKKIPLLGVFAAFSFLIMMFNVPTPGGTSAHAVGTALTAIILGPYAAVISTSIALLIQALFFGDGGVLAYGANAFNMAAVMAFSSYFIFNFLKNRIKSSKGEKIGAFIAGYIALNLAAFSASLELGIQPILFHNAAGQALYCPYPFSVSIPAMMSAHAIIGIVEGIVTVAVYSYIKKASDDTIYANEIKGTKKIYKGLIGLLVAMIIIVPIGLFAASRSAWGEWDSSALKAMIGYVPKGMKSGVDYQAIGSGYGFAGMGTIPGYILSGVIGVVLLVILFKILASLKKDEPVNFD
ncbi:cobalt transporter CbiM [uncultured Clostridium sp.]|jgi:cobalt/nickel transport system permease protein|uniref:cobalt transporter CbiM n=1 Tax=uncultured Clostridium sp. TaxID=59620 RepID=UPI002612F89C|nr:cobalt transporter CbiM [uncultured Clostridium sp.]